MPLELLKNIKFWLTYIMCENYKFLQIVIVFTHNISQPKFNIFKPF
jgi:hypothetical protein